MKTRREIEVALERAGARMAHFLRPMQEEHTKDMCLAWQRAHSEWQQSLPPATTEQPARQDAAYAELRALAEKATLGPWWTEPNYADNGEYCGLDVVTPGAVIINGENAPNDDDATYIAAANPAAILALIADNDRLAERVRDLETVSNGIVAVVVSALAKERAAQDERVAVLEEQVATLKNIMALQNVALESKAELQTLAEDYPHADEAAKVEIVPDWPFCNPCCDYEDPHGGHHDGRSKSCSCAAAQASIARQKGAPPSSPAEGK